MCSAYICENFYFLSCSNNPTHTHTHISQIKIVSLSLGDNNKIISDFKS